MTDQRSSTWPLEHASNVFSQAGEDGVAEAILELLPGRNDWVVEFGAWDGVHLSNSRYFIKDHGFSGVLIEGSQERFSDLEALYQAEPKVHTKNRFVRTSGADTLDDILAETPIPQDFDYLSIDIDGNDFHVWKSLTRFKPKLVVIEFNPTVPTEVHFVQPDDFSLKHGVGIRTLRDLGRDKGYELAAITTANAFFVVRELFPLLGIHDNEIETLRTDTHYVTHVFSGYDGTVFRIGCDVLPWHGVPLKFAHRQQLSKGFRQFLLDYSPARRTAFYTGAVLRHPIFFGRILRRGVRNRVARRVARRAGDGR